MMYKRITVVYGENYRGHTNTMCGQNAEFLIVTAGCTYSIQWHLNG